MIAPAKFKRTSRGSPDGYPGECTDVPGFYGLPVGTLDAPKRFRPLRAFVRFAFFLGMLYVIESFFAKFF